MTSLGKGSKSAALSSAELVHYGRHLTLDQVGAAGQSKLKQTRVIIVGLGGLGSPLALYLAAAGIGQLGIVEFDRVEASNLQRQILYGYSQIGDQKLTKGIERLRDLNPHIDIVAHEERLTRENARNLVRRYDIVADGADNFATRYLVNDACVLEGRPLVSASILGFEGQLSVFNHGDGPCYRCLFPEPPPPGSVPSCAEGGVLGALPGTLGALQATEVIKLALGTGSPASGRLLHFDALSLKFSELHFDRDAGCCLCGDAPTQKELVDYEALCAGPPASIEEISNEQLRERTPNDDWILVDVRADHERELDAIAHSLHYPLDRLSADTLVAHKDKEIVLYCQSGIRSQQAGERLVAAGFRRVLSLAGGLNAYRR